MLMQHETTSQRLQVSSLRLKWHHIRCSIIENTIHNFQKFELNKASCTIFGSMVWKWKTAQFSSLQSDWVGWVQMKSPSIFNVTT